MTLRAISCFVSAIKHNPGWKTSRIECAEASGGTTHLAFDVKPGQEPQIGQFVTVRVAFGDDAEFAPDPDDTAL